MPAPPPNPLAPGAAALLTSRPQPASAGGRAPTVLVADADYHDYPHERISLQFVRWFSEASEGGGGAAAAAAGGGAERLLSAVPELACVTHGAPPLGSCLLGAQGCRLRRWPTLATVRRAAERHRPVALKTSAPAGVAWR
jgi:hypothetical protein